MDRSPSNTKRADHSLVRVDRQAELVQVHPFVHRVGLANVPRAEQDQLHRPAEDQAVGAVGNRVGLLRAGDPQRRPDQLRVRGRAEGVPDLLDLQFHAVPFGRLPGPVQEGFLVLAGHGPVVDRA